METFFLKKISDNKNNLNSQNLVSSNIEEGVQLFKHSQNVIIPNVYVPATNKIRRVSPLELELAYAYEGTIHNWINRIVEFFLSARPKIVCENQKDQIKMDEWSLENNFRELLKIHFQHKYIYGNAFWRWVTNEKGDNINLKIMDPKYMDILRDSFGNPLYVNGKPKAYVQHINMMTNLKGIPQERIVNQNAIFNYQGSKGIVYLPEEIIHFRLNRLGNSWWGIGQIEPIHFFVVNKKNADQGYAESLQRIGYPHMIVYVGDKENPSTPSLLHQTKETIMDLKEDSILFLPNFTRLEMLESKKSGDIKANLDYFVDGLVAGLGGPKSLITGLGQDTNRATLTDQKLWLERSLKMEQEDTSNDIQRNVFTKLKVTLKLQSVPKLIWQEVSMESIESKINRLINLINAGILDPNNLTLKKYIADIEDLPKGVV